MSDAPHVVPVYYDFASTLSYVAHRVLGRLGGRLEAVGIERLWRPLDLTMIAEWRRGAVIDAAPRRHVRAVARTLVGDLHVPSVWLDSRRPAGIALALAGSVREPAGSVREPAWRARVWTAIYEEGCDPDESGSITRARPS